MKIFSDIGRILYAVAMGIFGVLHFIYGSNMNSYVPGWLPAPLFWVYLTGAALIVACVFIIARIKYADIVAFLLAIMLLIFILLIHLPLLLNGDQTVVPNLLKDIGLMGAALTYSGIFKGN